MVDQGQIDTVARLAVVGAIAKGTSRECGLVMSWVADMAWEISPMAIMRIAEATRKSTPSWTDWGDKLEASRSSVREAK